MNKTSNKKTSRKKKNTNGQRTHGSRTIVRACHKVLNEMYLSFSSTHETIQRHGMDQMAHLLSDRKDKKVPGYFSKGRSDLSVGREALLTDLEETSRTWQYWVGVFVDNGDEVTCEIEAGSIENCTMSDLTPIMPQLVHGVLDEDIFDNKTIKDGDIKGWAWIAAPSTYLNFSTSDDFTLNLFIERFDVLNQELREKVNTSRQMKRVQVA